MDKKFPEMLLIEKSLHILYGAIGGTYASLLVCCPEFGDAVRDDVVAASGWETTGEFNQDDVRLAIGRVLCRKFGLDV